MTPFWLAWGAAFVAFEGYAIATRDQYPGGTLSSLVWRFTDHPAGFVIFFTGWVLLTIHFLFRKP
jgi:hypothetical protein